MVSLRSLLAGAALIAAPVMATLSPAELLERINDLSNKSQALQAPIQKITVLNAPLSVLGLGPIPGIMAAGTDILSLAAGIVSNLDGIPDGLDETEANEVLDAFHNCIHVNQDTLKVVVTKVDLIKVVPVFGGPAASLLGSFAGFANAIADFFVNISMSWVEQYEAQQAASSKAARANAAEKRAEVFVA